MAKQLTKQEKFWNKYYKQLEGMHIDEAGVLEDGYPFFVAITASGTRYRCEVSRDEEGNGPGFLFGLPAPPKE
jgi:hypothetical protein